MVKRLTPTTFASGPKDDVAVVDAYKLKTSEVQTGVKDINEVFKSSTLLDKKGGNLLDTKSYGKLLTSVDTRNGTLKVNETSLLQGIVAGNPTLLGSLKGLPPDVQAKLLRGGMPSTIEGTLGAFKTNLKQGDLSTLKGLSGTINALSNSSYGIEFLDKTGLATLAANISEEATALGLPNAFSTIVGALTDTGLVGQIVRKLLPMVASKSSISLLDQITASLTGRDVASRVPNLISTFMQNYNRKNERGIAYYRANYKAVDNSFKRIDPNYLLYTRNAIESPAVNGNAIVQSSAQYKEGMRAHAESITVTINSADANVDTSVNTPIEWYLLIANKIACAPIDQPYTSRATIPVDDLKEFYLNVSPLSRNTNVLEAVRADAIYMKI